MEAGKVAIQKRRINTGTRGGGYWEWRLQDGQVVHLRENPLNTSLVHLEENPGSLDFTGNLQDGQEKTLSILKKSSSDKGLRPLLQDGQTEPLERNNQDGQIGALKGEEITDPKALAEVIDLFQRRTERRGT
jgi:hypothetical protein